MTPKCLFTIFVPQKLNENRPVRERVCEGKSCGDKLKHLAKATTRFVVGAALPISLSCIITDSGKVGNQPDNDAKDSSHKHTLGG